MKSKIKKMLACLLVVLIYGQIPAQGINFETSDWASVKSKARAENKLIFVDAYTTWCGPCKSMDKHVFSDEKVGLFYNSNFIPFKINAEKGEGPHFAKNYNINSYPNLLFVNAEGELIIRKIGAMETDELLQFGQKALDSGREATAMTSAYNSGNRTPEFILMYLAFLKERDLPTEEIALWYFAMIGQAHWTTSENLQRIKQYIHNPYSHVIELLAKKKETEPEVANNHFAVYSTLFDIYNDYINATIKKGGNDKEMDQLVSSIDLNFYPPQADYLKFLTKKEIAKRDKDWESYTKTCITYVNNNLLDNDSALNNWAYVFYKNKDITDKGALYEALKWINIVLNNKKSDYKYYNYLDTHASLLYKLGRNKEALKVANDAVKAAEKVGADPKATITLIENIKANQ
jgi:thiol-disulfide isomerase/thioredoxin